MNSLNSRFIEITAKLFYRYRFLSTIFPRYRHLSQCWEISEILRSCKLFDSKYYLENNPDVAAAGMDPLFHYVKFGAQEGRNISTQDAGISRLTGLIDKVSSEGQGGLYKGLEVNPVANRLTKDPIVVLCNSGGNSFFEDARDLIVVGIGNAGLKAQAADETFKDFSPDQIYFIVAPHEFFNIGQGTQWREKKIFHRSILLTTEQAGSPWFSQSLLYCCKAALIFDIDSVHAQLLQSLGLPAYFLPLGYSPDFTKFETSGPLPVLPGLEGLPGDCHGPPSGPWHSRPLDLSFIGTLFPRREQFFAQNAEFFANYRCFFYLRRLGAGHIIQGRTDGLNAAATAGIARRSKISLNIHQSDLPYFEWFRIVLQGLWHKALVLTEPSYSVPGLKAGEDYLTADLWNFPATIRWLLETDTGMKRAEEIATSGHERFIRNFSSQRIFSWVASPREGSSACPILKIIK